jgi:hypothetical protein
VNSDSDWAGDKKKIIAAFQVISYMWKSRFQKLSSSKAEYFALSKAVPDVKFIVIVLQSLGIMVETQIMIKIENIDAIFMAENVSATSQMKYIDFCP